MSEPIVFLKSNPFPPQAHSAYPFPPLSGSLEDFASAHQHPPKAQCLPILSSPSTDSSTLHGGTATRERGLVRAMLQHGDSKAHFSRAEFQASSDFFFCSLQATLVPQKDRFLFKPQRLPSPSLSPATPLPPPSCLSLGQFLRPLPIPPFFPFTCTAGQSPQMVNGARCRFWICRNRTIVKRRAELHQP